MAKPLPHQITTKVTEHREVQYAHTSMLQICSDLALPSQKGEVMMPSGPYWCSGITSWHCHHLKKTITWTLPFRLVHFFFACVTAMRVTLLCRVVEHVRHLSCGYEAVTGMGLICTSWLSHISDWKGLDDVNLSRMRYGRIIRTKSVRIIAASAPLKYTYRRRYLNWLGSFFFLPALLSTIMVCLLD